jgi:hypothetical protein
VLQRKMPCPDGYVASPDRRYSGKLVDRRAGGRTGVAMGELGMHRRYGLLILLSAIAVAATVYGSWASFQPGLRLPFTVRWVDAHQALIEPIPGMTPAGLHSGDRLDLTAQSRTTRIALVADGWALPASARYPLVIERGAAQLRVTVHAVDRLSGGLCPSGEHA